MALANGWFIPLFISLLLFLIFEYSLKNTYLISRLFFTPPSNQLIMGLMSQRDRLNNILSAGCDNPELLAFKEGRIGPVGIENRDAGNGTQPVTDVVAPAGLPDNSQAANDILRPDKLVETLEKSTVKVFTKVGWGTGFFITSDLLVTNRHVIESQDLNSIYITSKMLGSRAVQVELIVATENANISQKDFAILKIKAPSDAMVPLKIGQDPTALLPVIAAGYPGAAVQTDENVVTPALVFSQGEVSVVQVQAAGPPLIIHTANISPGSSGGPLVNRCGQLVGVNTFIKGVEDQFDSRELFSLAASSLKEFLKSKNISFSEVPSCSTN